MGLAGPAPVIMVQGTASHVGKSTLVTALCRIFRQDGWRVAPFKAQNMALNSFVAVEGGEIGRAQALQAEAAGVPASVHMNPVLLKPEGSSQSQVVVLGRPIGSMSASAYHSRKLDLWPTVAQSLDRLRETYDLVIAEGAGSPAEINLRDGDLANMRVGLYSGAAVMLVGDIDRGGVFASLLGTLDLIDSSERALVVGMAINKFRGDLSLLEPGLRMLERRSGLPVLGVVPYLRRLDLPEEDSLGLPSGRAAPRGDMIDIAVVRLPRIANFDDFAPLEMVPGLAVRWVASGADLGRPDLIILPGTKTTVGDLAWMRANGLARQIVALVGTGTPILGICGGYQMLGATIRDPDGVESPEPEVAGLGLLPVVTSFAREKRTSRIQASITSGPLAGSSSVTVNGYQIYMGRVEAQVPLPPLLAISERDGKPAEESDGVASQNGLVLGTSCHGLFGNVAVSAALSGWLHARRGLTVPGPAAPFDWERQLDELAGAVRASLDVDRLKSACGLR
jgi:adenosylcobyric acid synthase